MALSTTYSDAELEAAWAARTVVELRRRSLIFNLCDQSELRRWSAGEVAWVNVPKPTWSGVSTSARGRGGDKQSASTLDADNVRVERTGGFSVTNGIPVEDAGESPWAMVDRVQSRQIYQSMIDAEDGVVTAIRGDLAGADKVTVGTAGTNYISRTAPYAGSGTGYALLYGAIRTFGLKMQRANALDGAGESVGQVWCLMHPELVDGLAEYLKDEKFSLDAVTEDALTLGAVFSDRQYQGRLKGVDLFGWNGLTVPTGTDNWVILFGCRAGAAAAPRTDLVQYFDPQENQSTNYPGHYLSTNISYAAQALESGLFTEVTIHAD